MQITILLIVQAVFIGLIFTYFWKLKEFFDYLKDKDPDTWEKLGEPGVIKNMFSPLNNASLYSFLFRGDFQNMEDKVAREKAKSLRNTVTVFGIVFLTAIVVVLFPRI